MLLTSDAQGMQLSRCRELGVARHLLKPVAPSELLDAILLALGHGHRQASRSPVVAPPQQAPAPLLVLVAEDNPVNQLL